MTKILLVDLSAALTRAIFGYQDKNPLSTSQGVPIYGVYGFFKTMFKGVKVFNPDIIIVCNDSKVSFRKASNSEYKEHRGRSDFREFQRRLLINCLHEMGIPVLEVEGYEADDILATVVNCPVLLDGQPIDPLFRIISGDKDMLQLIKQGKVEAHLWKSNGEDITYKTDEDVKREVGVYPYQMLDFKGMCGDNSDEINGIAGFGKKSGIDFFEHYGSYEEGLVDSFQKMKKRPAKLLSEGYEAFEISRQLAKLYIVEEYELHLSTRTEPVQDLKIFYEMFEFRTFGREIQTATWRQVDFKFKGRTKVTL